MENSIYNHKIKKILAKGSGIKIALFDPRAKNIISNAVPHSLFLENNFFLFDMLENKRTKMGQVTCVIFAEPASISSIISELEDPCYENYVIYFTNTIGDDDIHKLAEADRMCYVREIYEMHVDLHQLDRCLFTIDLKMDGYRPNQTDTDAARICSLLKTLDLKPVIQTHGKTKDLAMKVQEIMSSSAGTLVRMLFVDRSVDMITPLFYEWRYQSMVYEYLEYENGLVQVFKRTFSLFNDRFFEENKFREISQVGEALRACTARVHGGKLMSVLPDEKTQTMETHLNIHNFILKECIANAEISNAEYECTCFTYTLCEDVLKNKEISFEKKAKLFIVYLHTIGYEFNLNRDEMLLHKILKVYPEYIEAVDRYSVYAKQWPGKRYKHSFLSGLDIKLGYQPPICRLLRKHLERTLGDFENLDSVDFACKDVVVYIKGGVTYSEYRSIVEWAKGLNVYVLSDYIMGYKDIMKMVIPDEQKADIK